MRKSSSSIMMVIGTLGVGGTERQLVLIAGGMARRGWDVSVYSLAGEGPMSGPLRDAGVRVLAPPIKRPSSEGPAGKLFRLFATILDLRRQLYRRRIAIAHFFLPEAYIIGATAAMLARVPVRIMSRRSLNNYQRKRPFVGALERLLHRSLTAVLGNSRKVIEQLHGEGVPSHRLRLIYNGIDLSEFAVAPDVRARTRAGLGFDEDALVMIIVANLIPYKGHADLVAALIRANPELPSKWHLLVVGRDDGIQASLAMKAANGGIASKVMFLGQRRDVAALLASADIGFLVSHEEGFSNAVLEAMALGLPMIVTDVGGNAEAVNHHETGIVVPPADRNELARAIVTLAHNAGLRSRYGAAGRQRVSADFGVDAMLLEHERLYRVLLEGGSAGPS